MNLSLVGSNFFPAASSEEPRYNSQKRPISRKAISEVGIGIGLICPPHLIWHQTHGSFGRKLPLTKILVSKIEVFSVNFKKRAHGNSPCTRLPAAPKLRPLRLGKLVVQSEGVN
jgi:hypothetical protein